MPYVLYAKSQKFKTPTPTCPKNDDMFDGRPIGSTVREFGMKKEIGGTDADIGGL